MPSIDLNCDLGEGAGHDAELMPLITSANIACGGHAGDAATMRATVALAQKHGVVVGAHPGFPDRANFGRVELAVTPDEVHELVLDQIRRLQALAPLRHVKPHGALYNMAAREPALARALVDAVYEADPRLILFGLAGSHVIAAGEACGLPVASEVFADRTYQADGSLTPRTQSDALITDAAVAMAQVRRMVREGKVRATDGTDVLIRADTVCVHGDGANPVEFARRLRHELSAAGIAIKAFGT
ncbi:MAG: LamB/YcsF family protein [Opitutaceae bacterium]|nr:LamB/YcsF family protein [Opitutaceae bacterium]